MQKQNDIVKQTLQKHQEEKGENPVGNEAGRIRKLWLVFHSCDEDGRISHLYYGSNQEKKTWFQL